MDRGPWTGTMDRGSAFSTNPQRGVKVSDIHRIQSGTVNLAKFTLIPPWHTFGCVKYVRVNRLCLLVLCGGL